MTAELSETYPPLRAVESEPQSQETLFEKRQRLQDELGQLSAALCDVSKQYNACISELVTVNDDIRANGDDTYHFAQHLRSLSETPQNMQ